MMAEKEFVEWDETQIGKNSEDFRVFAERVCPRDNRPQSEHTWLKVRRLFDTDGLAFGYEIVDCIAKGDSSDSSFQVDLVYKINKPGVPDHGRVKQFDNLPARDEEEALVKAERTLRALLRTARLIDDDSQLKIIKGNTIWLG